jgi:3-oxoacyl-[acyl-carrier protein] reductase
MNEVRTLLERVQRVGFFGLGVNFHDCYGQLVLALGRKPDFLCDNDPGKWGQEFFGKKCLTPGELGQLGGQTAVIITVRKYEEIHRQLSAFGLKDIFVACFDRGYDVVQDIKSLESRQRVGKQEPLENRVRGKWTLITGASRGIGRQIALQMAKLGSNIIAHSRKMGNTKDLLDSCLGMGVQVIPVAAEFSNLAELEEMLKNLERGFPPIDIVYNNAAISLPSGSDSWAIPWQHYSAHYTVNTIAPIQICYHLIPPMIRRGYGRVINISSTIQKRPGEMPYACSKAALSKFVYDMAPSLRGTGVSLSLVCPGYVRSDMGGANAPHPVESMIPGALLGAFLDGNFNGHWFFAQDYSGLSLSAAIERAKFYHSEKA